MSARARARAVGEQLAAIRARQVARYGLAGIADVRVIVRVTLWESAGGGQLRPVLTGCRDAVLEHVRAAPAGSSFVLSLAGELPVSDGAALIA